MIYNVVNIYAIVVGVLIALCLLDWVLGIDKLNNYIDSVMIKYNIQPDPFFPAIALTLGSYLTYAMYYFTKVSLFDALYNIGIWLALSYLLLVAIVFVIVAVLSGVRVVCLYIKNKIFS